jgi:NADP-dependent 3-hydroxy acid dehydrogenase YdfG
MWAGSLEAPPQRRPVGWEEEIARLKILVTGTAGFIGSHTAQALIQRGDEVIGVDNLNE